MSAEVPARVLMNAALYNLDGKLTMTVSPTIPDHPEMSTDDAKAALGLAGVPSPPDGDQEAQTLLSLTQGSESEATTKTSCDAAVAAWKAGLVTIGRSVKKYAVKQEKVSRGGHPQSGSTAEEDAKQKVDQLREKYMSMYQLSVASSLALEIDAFHASLVKSEEESSSLPAASGHPIGFLHYTRLHRGAAPMSEYVVSLLESKTNKTQLNPYTVAQDMLAYLAARVTDPRSASAPPSISPKVSGDPGSFLSATQVTLKDHRLFLQKLRDGEQECQGSASGSE